MRVYTIQLNKWRRLKNLDIPLLDITVKSGDKAFAPTFEMVMDVKAGRITPEEYTTRYLSMMRHSYTVNRGKWIDLTRKQNLVLGCYCAAGKFCHRHLMVDILRNVTSSLNLPFTDMGELVV